MIMEAQSYITTTNNAKVLECTSQSKSCNASNVLSNDRKSIWLTESKLPQSITIDISKLLKRPIVYKCFGIYCWHAYNTNPKLIEIFFSKDQKNYSSFGKFTVNLKPGNQYFVIDEVDSSMYKSFKLTILETYGGLKTYLNKIYLLEDMPKIQDISIISNENKSGPKARKLEIKKEKQVIDYLNDNCDSNNEKSDMFPENNNDNKSNFSITISKNCNISEIKKEKEENFEGQICKDYKSFDYGEFKNKKKPLEKINNNEKTLQDRLQEMENHLSKLKLDQNSEKTLLNYNYNSKSDLTIFQNEKIKNTSDFSTIQQKFIKSDFDNLLKKNESNISKIGNIAEKNKKTDLHEIDKAIFQKKNYIDEANKYSFDKNVEKSLENETNQEISKIDIIKRLVALEKLNDKTMYKFEMIENQLLSENWKKKKDDNYQEILKNQKTFEQEIEKKFEFYIEILENKLIEIISNKISTFENKFIDEIDELKSKIQSIEIGKVRNFESKTYDTSNFTENSNPKNNFQKNKIENIQTIAERLHQKLNEKERKLNELQLQANDYLKRKK